MKEYVYSKIKLDQMKKKCASLFLFFLLFETPSLIVLSFLKVPSLFFQKGFIVCLTLFIMIPVAFPFLVLPRLLKNQLLKQKLIIGSDKIIKQGLKRSEVVSFDAITKIKRFEGSEGILFRIDIHQSHRCFIVISNFESMEEIDHFIKNLNLPSIIVETQRLRLYPVKIEYFFLLFSLIPLLSFGLLSFRELFLTNNHKEMMDHVIFSIGSISVLLAGAFFVIYKPMSRIDLGYKRKEQIFGIVIFIVYALTLIAYINNCF